MEQGVLLILRTTDHSRRRSSPIHIHREEHRRVFFRIHKHRFSFASDQRECANEARMPKNLHPFSLFAIAPMLHYVLVQTLRRILLTVLSPYCTAFEIHERLPAHFHPNHPLPRVAQATIPFLSL